MSRTNLNNSKSRPGLYHALGAAILFGTLAGLVDAGFIISHHSIPTGLGSLLQFANSAAILTTLAYIPYMLIVLIVIRIIAKWRKLPIEAGLAALFFMGALPAGILTAWNVAEQFAAGSSNSESLAVYSFFKYAWLLIPVAWALGVWLARMAANLEFHQLAGRYTAFIITFTAYLLLIPIFQTKFISGSGLSTSENLIIIIATLIVALIFFPIISRIASLIAKMRNGAILGILWIIAISIPFFPSLIFGPTTSGSPPSDVELSGRNANVILVSIDTLRADDVGIYGSEVTETPVLDSLAQNSLVFKNALTPMPITGPAHMTMLSGLQPDSTFGHGVKSNGVLLPSEIPTIASTLDRSGYATGAVIGGSPLTRQASGLERGFHYYNDVFEDSLKSRIFPSRTWSLTISKISRKIMSIGGIPSEWIKKPADKVTDQAIDWLSENHRDPFFLFLHYYDPHSPFNPPPPFDNMYQQNSNFRDEHPISSDRLGDEPRYPDENLAKRRAIYRGEVSFTDQEFGRLIEYGDQIGLWDNTLLIVTADHGEAFGPYYIGHINRLYESVVNVPLIIRNPDTATVYDSPVWIDSLVNISDIYFTVLDFLEINDSISAHELHANIPGALPDWDHNLLDCSPASNPESGWDYIPMLTHGAPTAGEIEVGRIYAFRFPGYKLIFAPEKNDLLPEYQYFNLIDDPGETIDIFGKTDPDDMPLANAPALLSSWSSMQRTSGVSSMDPRIRAQLEALGYVQK